MGDLETTIKSNEYKGRLEECFGDIGYFIVDSEKQKECFNREFVKNKLELIEDNIVLKKSSITPIGF
jgi:hypothetical protein